MDGDLFFTQNVAVPCIILSSLYPLAVGMCAFLMCPSSYKNVNALSNTSILRKRQCWNSTIKPERLPMFYTKVKNVAQRVRILSVVSELLEVQGLIMMNERMLRTELNRLNLCPGRCLLMAEHVLGRSNQCLRAHFIGAA